MDGFVYGNGLHHERAKSLKKQAKEADTNFALLCRSRNMIGQFKKAYLYRPIKILHFLTPATILKYLT